MSSNLLLTIKIVALLIGIALIAAAGLLPLEPIAALLLAVTGAITGIAAPLIGGSSKRDALPPMSAHALASAYVCGKHSIGQATLVEVLDGSRTDVDAATIRRDYETTLQRFETKLAAARLQGAQS